MLGCIYSKEPVTLRCKIYFDLIPALKVLKVGESLTLNPLEFNRARYGEAEFVLREALKTIDKACGANHRDSLIILDALGQVLTDTGDFTEAGRFLERALSICEGEFGPHHKETAARLHRLAIASRDDFATRQRLFDRALSIYEKDEDHPDTANVMMNKASFLEMHGDLTGARSLNERALTIQQRVLGPMHEDPLALKRRFASLLERLGDLADAKSLRECLAAYEQTKDASDTPGWSDRTDLARLLLGTGDPIRAVIVGRAALAVAGRYGVPEDSARVTADALHALGRTDEASAMREKYGITPEVPSTS